MLDALHGQEPDRVPYCEIGLAGYLKPENVLALSHAVQAHGRYPIQLARPQT